LEKVRELVAISNDPNRPPKDREPARRGARRITMDLAESAGLTLTPEEIDGAANPLLARIDGWGKNTEGAMATSNAVGLTNPHISKESSLSTGQSLVEQSSYHQERREPIRRSSYARAMENRRLRANRPSRKSPPSDRMQVLLIDHHGETLRKATLLADYAHDDGDLTQVTLNHRVDSIDADGSYRPADGPIAARIGIRRECAYPLLTTLHEIGHHLRGKLDSEMVARVAEMARESESGQICTMIGLDEDYWLSESEIFSRVYSQWFIERTNDPEASAELKTLMEGADSWQQFQGKEWTEMCELVDNIMKKKGWL
jgi:hypothetical protein